MTTLTGLFSKRYNQKEEEFSSYRKPSTLTELFKKGGVDVDVVDPFKDQSGDAFVMGSEKSLGLPTARPELTPKSEQTSKREFLSTGPKEEKKNIFDLGLSPEVGKTKTTTPPLYEKPEYNPKESGYFKDLGVGLTDFGKSNVPVGGTVAAAFDIKKLRDISSKLDKNKKLSSNEATWVNDFLTEKEELAEKMKEPGYAQGSTVRNSLTFMAELLAASAISSGSAGIPLATLITSKGIVKGGKELIEKMLKDKVTRQLIATIIKKKAKQVGIETAAVTAVHTPEGTLERMTGTPEFKENGDFRGLANDGQPLPEALVNSISDYAVEVLSERSGEIMGPAFKSIMTTIDTPIRNSLIKAGILKAIQKSNPKLQPSKIKQLVQRAGWNTVLVESAEERVGDAMRGVLFDIGLGDQPFEMPTKEQIINELVSFSIMGGAFKAADSMFSEEEINEFKEAEKQQPIAPMPGDEIPPPPPGGGTGQVSVVEPQAQEKDVAVYELEDIKKDAEQMGQEAKNNGVNRIFSQDEIALDMRRTLPDEQKKAVMEAWYSGWDSANLTKEKKDVPAEAEKEKVESIEVEKAKPKVESFIIDEIEDGLVNQKITVDFETSRSGKEAVVRKTADGKTIDITSKDSLVKKYGTDDNKTIAERFINGQYDSRTDAWTLLEEKKEENESKQPTLESKEEDKIAPILEKEKEAESKDVDKSVETATIDDGLKLERASYGLKPKNALDRLLKAESIYKELGAKKQLQDIQPVIENRKKQVGIIKKEKPGTELFGKKLTVEKGAFKGIPIEKIKVEKTPVTRKEIIKKYGKPKTEKEAKDVMRKMAGESFKSGKISNETYNKLAEKYGFQERSDIAFDKPRKTDVNILGEKKKTKKKDSFKKSPLTVKFKKAGTMIFANEKITSPADVAFAFKELKNSAVEKFYAIGLKNKKPITVEMISMGTLNASLVHPREVTALLLNKKVDEVYYLHNHPSGEIDPSEADIMLTGRLEGVHKEVGIKHSGHIIIDTEKFMALIPGKEDKKFTHLKAAKNPTEVAVYEKYLQWAEGSIEKVKINGPKSAYEISKGIQYDDSKNGIVFFLDARNNILSYEIIPKKDINFKNIFPKALKLPTANILVAERFGADTTLEEADYLGKIKKLQNSMSAGGIELTDYLDVNRTGNYVSYIGEKKEVYGEEDEAKQLEMEFDKLLKGVKKEEPKKKKEFLEPKPAKKERIFGRSQEYAWEKIGRPEIPKDFPIKISPEDLSYDLGVQSAQGYSFDPELRAVRAQKDYVESVIEFYDKFKKEANTDAKKDILIEHLERYKENYIKKESAILSANSRVISPMIAGPANFPVAKMSKKRDVVSRRTEEFFDWAKKADKNITKAFKKVEVEEAGGELGMAKKQLKEAQQMQDKMKFANAIIRKKTLSEEDKQTELLKIFSKKIVDEMMEPDFTGKKGFRGFYLTNNNTKIKRLKEKIATLESRAEKAETIGTKTIAKRDGVEVIVNYEADRMQFLFDEIPSAEIRSKLKSNGWRWSPRNKAWQRKITANARYSVKRILEEEFKQADMVKDEPGLAKTLRGTKGMTADDIMKKYSDIALKRDVQAKDVYGNKKTIEKGEELTPYELKGGKILLQDGQTYLVSKNQFQNIKGNSTVAEAKQFAPELEGTEETVKGGYNPFETLSDEELKQELENADINPNGLTRSEMELELSSVFENDMGTQFNLEQSDPKYYQYQLPGGKNYKEILIKESIKETFYPEKVEIIRNRRSVTQGEVTINYDGKKLATFDDSGKVGNNYREHTDAELMKSAERLWSTGSDINHIKPVANTFKSSHWDEPNVISHLRLNERTYNGKKVTFMEELQSDWAREGRSKGFQNDKNATEFYKLEDEISKIKSERRKTEYGSPEYKEITKEIRAIEQKMENLPFGKIPSHPLVQGNKWQEPSIKRALKEAVDNDSDYFAWINGEQTSARYNLSTQVEEVKWSNIVKRNGFAGHQPGMSRTINIKPKDKVNIVVETDVAGKITGGYSVPSDWTGKKLDEVLGKGLADSIMAKETGALSGEGLKFGGEWANNLYDRQVKNIVEKLTGAKAQKIDLGLPIENKKEPAYFFRNQNVAERMNDIKRGDKIVKQYPNSGRSNWYIIIDKLPNNKLKVIDYNRISNISDTPESYIKDIGNPERVKARIRAKNPQGDTTEDFIKTRIADQKRFLDSNSLEIEIKDPKVKTTQQQAIKLTPEIKAKIKGEAIETKTSGELYEITYKQSKDGESMVMDKKRKIKTGAEQLKEREEAKRAREDAKLKRDSLKFYDNLEDQYKDFKKLRTKEAEDIEQLRSRNKKIDKEYFDSIFYSQEQSMDDIYEIFLDRYRIEREPLPKVPEETKAVVAEKTRQQVKSAKNILDRRRSFIRAAQKQFGLSDADVRKINRKDIRLMSNYEYHEFIKAFRIKAAELAKTRFAKNRVLSLIRDKSLQRVENLRKALSLPPISKMKEEELAILDDILSEAKTGDIFLTQRQLETVAKTDLAGIKTIREARERLAEEIDVDVEDLNNIKVSEFDRLRFDTALAEKNPFYKMMVEETHTQLLTAEENFLNIENKINELTNKARKSRKRGLFEKLIPTDELVFDYLSGKYDLAEQMTPEELELANYLQLMFADALDYLVSNKILKSGRDNYITNVRRGFLEALKTDGTGEAIKEIFDKQKQDEQVFDILDSETEAILPLEKFFQFSLRRSGKINPTKNVAKAASIYFRTIEKKKALDALVPKLMIYVDSLTPQRLTPRGLEMDRRLKKFVTEWLNNKKGRKTKLIAKQGGKIDIALSTTRNFLYFKDLAFSLPIGMASVVGEQVATFVNVGNRRYLNGIKRRRTKKGQAILNKYKNFIGKNIWEELMEPSKNIGDKFNETMFGMFAQATVEANKIHLLGALTKGEYESGEISSKRLAELRLEIGRLRMVSAGKSIIGSTAEGQIFTQYKTWAIPIFRTMTKDFAFVAKNLSKGKVKKTATSKELREILRASEVTLAVLFLGMQFIDDDDESFIGQLTKRLYMEALTVLGALDSKTMLAVPRLLSFLENIGMALHDLILLENYKTKKGFKGWNELKREFKPGFLRQFTPSKKKEYKSIFD